MLVCISRNQNIIEHDGLLEKITCSACPQSVNNKKGNWSLGVPWRNGEIPSPGFCRRSLLLVRMTHWQGWSCLNIYCTWAQGFCPGPCRTPLAWTMLGRTAVPVCFPLKKQVKSLAAITAGIANEDLTVTKSRREKSPLFIALQRIYIAMGKGATLMCSSCGSAWHESQTSAWV